MTYELAKQLDEAGFPFRIPEITVVNGTIHLKDGETLNGYLGEQYVLENKVVINPTLSELIAACGDRFSYLHQGRNRWHAHSHANAVMDEYGEEGGDGSTPQEAVAKLYIAIHAKD